MEHVLFEHLSRHKLKLQSSQTIESQWQHAIYSDFLFIQIVSLFNYNQYTISIGSRNLVRNYFVCSHSSRSVSVINGAEAYFIYFVLVAARVRIGRNQKSQRTETNVWAAISKFFFFFGFFFFTHNIWSHRVFHEIDEGQNLRLFLNIPKYFWGIRPFSRN